MARRLQIPLKDGDYERYLSYTEGSRFKGLAFINALFKIRTENHIQCVIIGDFGQGKSTSATLLTKLDTKYTRELLKRDNWNEFLKYGDRIHFTLDNHVIISPKDPASKFLTEPKKYNAYEVDEGYLFATTSEATTRATKKFINDIAQNRKLRPSIYYIYPNLFKMPTHVLELMNEVMLKIYVNKGVLLVPTRMIQLAEKFDRALIEKYAKKPNSFEGSIKYHPNFITTLTTPNWGENFHQRYLEKYKKYEIKDSDEAGGSTSKVEKLFEGISKMQKNRTVEIRTKADIKALLQNALAPKMGKNAADSTSSLLAEEYMNWTEEKAVNLLSKNLQGGLAHNLDFGNLLGDEPDTDEE